MRSQDLQEHIPYIIETKITYNQLVTRFQEKDQTDRNSTFGRNLVLIRGSMD